MHTPSLPLLRGRIGGSAAALLWRSALAMLAVAVMLLLVWWMRPAWLLPGTQALVTQQGDPYIRALMRTISASEANVLQPYAVLHGGEFAQDISTHPNRCVGIRQGPNRGNCSTAAGRYQLLYTTWMGLSARYHPQWDAKTNTSEEPSFAPLHQDAVVLAWLSDRKAWGMDLSEQLRQGRVRPVLRRLSGTWTSLGYGIENNVMSAELPRVYRQLLEAELERARKMALLPAAALQKQQSP